MRTALCALAAVLLLILAACAGSAQVIRTDPNIPHAAAAKDEPSGFWEDERLAQPVTYEALEKPVRDILDDLTEMTGVKLNAGYNNNDWQVRDRRMVVFAKDLPLKDLMQSIARVMKFQWSRSDYSGAWTYRLWMDRKVLLGEQAQRAREEQREEEYIHKQREKLLDLMDSASQLTDEDLAEMKESDPYGYALAKSGVGPAMSELMQHVPKLRQAILAGDEVRLRGRDFPPEAEDSVAKLVEASPKLMFDRYRRDPEGVGSLDKLDNINIWTNHEFVERLQRGDPVRRLFLFDLEIEGSRPPKGDSTEHRWFTERALFLNPDSEAARIYGSFAARAIDGESSPDTIITELQPQIPQIVAAERTDSDWGEPLVEHPEDPELQRVVKFGVPKVKRPDGTERERKLREDICRTLVKTTGMSVVSDFFFSPTSYSPSPGPWKPDARIIDALTYIEENYISNWWRHGSVIEVRDRFWFRKRGMQIPDAWIDRWARECDRKGVIEIDSLAQICSLTEEQFRYNFEYTIGWPYDFFIRGLNVAYEKDRGGLMMRFYASLTKYQKGALLQDGLDTRTLTPAQWNKLADLPVEGVATITAQRSDTRKPYIDENGEELGITGDIGYTFTGYAKDGSVIWDQRVPLPVKWERKK